MSNKNSVLLEVDPSLIDNNLLVYKDDIEADDIELLLKRNYENDGILVLPTPGFCIKTWKDGSDEKCFINICHTEHIPQPNDISDEEIIKILGIVDDNLDDSKDIDNKFRLPMSIGELRKEYDKAGRPCDVCDVAVNTNFFNNKIMKNFLFKSFLVTASMEGIEEKYKIILVRDKEPVVLKNRKCMGEIKKQRIQKRGDRSQPYTPSNKQKCLIEEVSPSDSSILQNAKTKRTSELCQTTSLQPYQILIDSESATNKNAIPKILTVNVLIKEPKISSGKGLILDVGEDRVLVRAPSTSSNLSTENRNDRILLDIFLPYNIVQEESCALFCKSNKVLTITLPVAA